MTYSIKLPYAYDFYDGEYPVNFSAMQPAPALLIFKASGKTYWGTRYQDTRVEQYVAEAKSRGIKYGLYHFLRPHNIFEQAMLFCSVWDKCGGASTRPIVDVEVDPRLAGAGYATWRDHIKYFLDIVERHTGKIPMIYTSKNYWGFTYVNGQPPAWTDRYPLWLAWYPYYPDQFQAPPTTVWPGGWTKWAMWQWEDGGRSNGYPGNDLNLLSAWYAEEVGAAAPPEPPALQVEQFAIIRHRWMWDKPVYLPEGRPMQNVPVGDGKGDPIPVPPIWWKFIAKVNNEQGYKYVRSTHSFWINQDYDVSDPDATPHAESIECAHNFVSFDKETTTHIRLLSFRNDEDPNKMDPLKVNWQMRPDLFFKPICSKDDELKHINVWADVDAYIPLIAKVKDGIKKDLWLPKEWVEIFPRLPCRVTVNAATLPWLNIRSSADAASAKVGQYLPGQSFTLYGYRPRGASVWGRTDRGWVCLLIANVPGQRVFTTDWTLDTTGVIPPG